MKAVLCPVCNGVGQVSAGFYSRGGDCPYWVSSTVNPEICRSCDGKGWVEVREDKPITDLGYELTDIDYGVAYNHKCPACGGDRNEPSSTGCPQGSHYGSYCEA